MTPDGRLVDVVVGVVVGVVVVGDEVSEGSVRVVAVTVGGVVVMGAGVGRGVGSTVVSGSPTTRHPVSRTAASAIEAKAGFTRPRMPPDAV